MQVQNTGNLQRPSGMPIRRRDRSRRAAPTAAMRATQATPRVVDLLCQRIREDLAANPLELEVEEHAVRLAEIVRQVSEDDFYRLLGVSEEADDKEVHATYTSLARLVHPDHATRPGLECRRKALEMLFDRITSSYIALSDGDRRSIYSTARVPTREEVQPLNRREEMRQLAAHSYRLSQSYMKMMDYSVVVDLLREAARMDPQPRYFERLAQAQARNPRWIGDAVDSYRSAVELRPEDAGLRLGLAQTLERAGDEEGAREQYREVLKLDPDNGIALHAVGPLGSPSVNAVMEAGSRLTRAVKLLISGEA